jgi:hypothetical protein
MRKSRADLRYGASYSWMLAEDLAAQKRLALRRWLLLGASVLLVLIGGALIFVLAKWPFTRNSVTRALGQVLSSTVEIKEFRSTYFPRPGCIAEGVVFRDGRGEGRIQKLTIEAAWTSLLTGRKRIERITGDGLFVRVLAHGETANGAPPEGNSSNNSKLVVGEIVANQSVLEVMRNSEGKAPLRFDVHELSVRNVGAGRAMSYRTALHNPEPPGEIHSSGEIGPWQDLARMPLQGSYTFEHADLGVFHLIGGMLSSKGTFKGILERIEVQGPISISDFEVKSSGHPVNLSAQFHAVVNGTNGDTMLEPVEAHFAGTTIVANGGVLGRAGQKGKTISVNMETRPYSGPDAITDEIEPAADDWRHQLQGEGRSAA